MNQMQQLFPGITLRCFSGHRFKHGCLSLQLVRPMCRQEAAMNALLPAVLLRGSQAYPDLRAITLRLDDLYGASVSALVRRVGDYQTTGLYCSFVEDRFAMEGDVILAPMVAFVRELLLEPALEDGCFRSDYVESEKKNLIATIESNLNDKRTYAMEQMVKRMCSADSFGIPRLGEKEDVAAITPEALYSHYRRILSQSRIDLCYVGSARSEEVACLLKELFAGVFRDYQELPPQTSFATSPESTTEEVMDVKQGKLCMGFVTPETIRDDGFAAVQVLNMIFGGGMTSKLFVNVRERRSLCYAIGSAYHGSKGIVTVSAGIDNNMLDTVKEEIMAQLEACRQGDISEEELVAAKQALRASLQATHDSPGAMESYYASGALSGLLMTPAQYIEAVENITVSQVAEAAKSLQLHTVYFLKGVTE